MRTVLFYSDFTRLFGSTLKVWDYFNHVLESPGYTAYTRFSSKSVWDESNPWKDTLEHVVHDASDLDVDVLFLSGIDWLELEPVERDHSRVPVINLIQSLWHACPNDHLSRYSFLTHKAVRICVSPQVTRAIANTRQARGPLYTIPAALDYPAIAEAEQPATRAIDLLIVAHKDPGLGERLLARLDRPGRASHLAAEFLPREELLDWMRRATVTVFVPRHKEGFYLPALEGMALGTIVVCPDCVGNRSFCLHGVNCLRPEYNEEDLVSAAESALADPGALEHLVEKGAVTAREHDLRGEREAFLDILRNVDALWERI